MKRTLKRIFSCVIVIILLAFVLGKATNIAQRKYSDYKYIPFFEHSNDYDVLFMGTSHVLNAVFPMELWNVYGITSYNFGGHSNQLATTYWVLMNALDYSKPEVVVIDCFQLGSQQKTADNFEHIHFSLDAFPLSITKIKTANDLLDDPEIDRKINEGIITDTETRTRLGILWDYSVYHSRWEEIESVDFEVSSSREYGAESRIQIAQPEVIVDNPGVMLTEETVGVTYLKKMIEECQKNNIDVLLTYLPYPITDESSWIDVNTVYDIAKEYGVDYINFLDEDVVDFSTDCYDSFSHLNPSGAWKTTDYLGQYLQEKYSVADHRNDEKYSYWYDDYKTYEEVKNSRLNDRSDLNTYLMLLEDANYGFVMSIGDTSIFEDSTTINLLKNKGVNVEELNDETQHIIVCGDDIQVINSEINEDGSYGNLSIFYNDEGQYGVYRDTEELLVLSSDTLIKKDGVISINVFNMDDRNNVVNTSTFAIPKTLEVDERYPEKNGMTVLSSKAIRVSE